MSKVFCHELYIQTDLNIDVHSQFFPSKFSFISWRVFIIHNWIHWVNCLVVLFEFLLDFQCLFNDFYLDQSTSQISMFLKWNLIISHKIWVLISILSKSIEIKNITNLGANDFSLWCDTLYSKTNCTHINRSTWHYIKESTLNCEKF